MTNNLIRRIHEHRNELVDGFSKKYRLHKLLYFETFNDPTEAILREKQIKHWNRQWKLRIIKETNPNFKDLYAEVIT